jgi:N-acetylmuramic acid 6-phosphate etherase
MTSSTNSGLDQLGTEGVRTGLEDLNERPPAAIVDVLLTAEARVPAVLAAARDGLAEAVTAAERALRAGGRLIYVGAGTPGRLAALDAAECVPTFGVPPHLVLAVLAGGEEAAAMAVEGAEDDAAAGAAELAALAVDADDLVVGISASGRTPYVLAALDTANAVGATTVAIVNNPGSPAAARADVAVELLTGPEVIAGSTRLTAGTAQKIALNVLSTAAMVRWGRTHGPWMIDVLATNEKLRRRAQRMLSEITGASDDSAAAALAAAEGDTRVALRTLLA